MLYPNLIKHLMELWADIREARIVGNTDDLLTYPARAEGEALGKLYTVVLAIQDEGY